MSFPTPSELREFPYLHDWLAQQRWLAFFKQEQIDQGRAYVNDSSILAIEIDDELDECFLIHSVIRESGTRTQEVQIELTPLAIPGGTVYSPTAQCTCPTFSHCKHATATLARLSLICAPRPGTRPVSTITSKEGISQEASNWLEELRSASIEKKAARPRPNNNFLAYCIEPLSFAENSVGFQLVLRPGSRLKSGLVRIKNSQTKSDPSKPAAYVTDEDIPLLARYRGLHSNVYEEPGLEGDGWPEILLAALKFGRLYFSPSSNGYQSEADHTQLSSGPPVTAEPTWETGDNGASRPVIRFKQPRLILLPTHPAYYIDPTRHLIGPIDSKLPAELLTTWVQGPSIHPNELPTLSDRLAHLPKTARLPAPVELPTETLPPSLPHPRLDIRNERVGEFRHFDTLLGVLTFQYPGSPPFPPLSNKQSPVSSWITDGKRYILTRNARAEKSFEKHLHKCALAPLHKTIPSNRLRPELRHAVVVEKPYPTVQASWVRFVADHADSLRAAGWTIDIDPSSGLVIHDLVEFLPAIQHETTHGIDWFQFDVTADIGGKETNIIPFIADAVRHGLLDLPDKEIPATFLFRGPNKDDGYFRFPGPRFIEICRNVAHLFHGDSGVSNGRLKLDRLSAAGIADSLGIDNSETTQALAALGSHLRDITGLPKIKPPAAVKAELRPYQLEGFRWLRFLADNQLHGILADDMGLGKTVQTLAHLATKRPKRSEGKPSLVIAPTSVITNWAAEAKRFTPRLKVLLLHGPDRAALFPNIPKVDLVLTSYPLLVRDSPTLTEQHWHTLVLDEAQYIKNPATAAAQSACQLIADHRLCLSGTPMENHLGELWSLMHFLMPGFLPAHKAFTQNYRRPIERDRNANVQLALNRRIAPLILRRTKDQVATDLPPKTHIIHRVALSPKETDLYESVRALMDKRVRDALADKGLGQSHIIVLDALLKLRQICCHPILLKSPAAQEHKHGTKLDFLTNELLPTLFEEKRRILLFSQFTSVLKLIEAHLSCTSIPFLKLTGETRNRANLVKQFQTGDIPIFLISLKAGGTGLNLTAADTVIHYDPWWNPAAENQATDRAHRIGQTKPVFVHKLICEGTIEDRIVQLQENKSALVDALLSEETSKLKLDPDTLSHLLAPLS